MKKLIIFSCLLPFWCVVHAQAELTFIPSDTIDYGEVEYASNTLRTVQITNHGNQDLRIHNAASSCGCLVPSWPKEALAPGDTAVISVRYDTKRVGAFVKSITLTTNAGPDADQYFTITVRGRVRSTTTALNDPHTPKVEVYPTLAHTQLNIQSDQPIRRYFIFDRSRGRILHAYDVRHMSQLYIGHLPNGWFWLVVEFESGQVTQRTFCRIGE